MLGDTRRRILSWIRRPGTRGGICVQYFRGAKARVHNTRGYGEVSKRSKEETQPAKPATGALPVTAAVGLGRPVEVHTVSALVHLTILRARRAQAVATILRRANARLTPTPAPRSDAEVDVSLLRANRAIQRADREATELELE
jgi:hypothetical protein